MHNVKVLIASLWAILIVFVVGFIALTAKVPLADSRVANPATVVVAFETVSSDESLISLKPTRRQRVNFNTKSWKKFWLNYGGTTAPEIDFGKYVVVGAFAGTKSTGGNTIEITGVTRKKNVFIVTITETSAGKNCLTTQAITYPYHIVKFQKPDKRSVYPVFRITKKTADCASAGADANDQITTQSPSAEPIITPTIPPSTSPSPSPSPTSNLLENGKISGVVMIGPTCPVVRVGHEAECADRPYAGANISIRKSDRITEITTAKSDSEGKFTVNSLKPGDYWLVPLPENNVTPPTGSSQKITVSAGQTTNVIVNYDSGIR